MQIASLTGLAVMLLSHIFSFADVVFAVGFAIVFLGMAFSNRSSTKAIPIEDRLPFTVLEFIVTPAVIAAVCYIVWDYTGSIAGFLCVLTVAVVAWLTTYKATRHLLRGRPDTV